MRVIFALFLFWGVARFAHHQTDGLKLTKFLGTVVDHGVSPPLTKKTRQHLTQTFTYMGRGKESFAFVSEDGQWVLKLFSNKYQSRLFWLKALTPWRKEKIAYNEGKLHLTYESYRTSFEKMREASALAHLQTGRGEPIQVTLIDRLNISHRLDLSGKAFALQKRAQLAFDFFDTCTSDDARTALFALMDQLRGRMALGLGDRDPNPRVNLGFVDGLPIRIDLGPLIPKPDLTDPKNHRPEAEAVTLALKHYFENHHPEHLPHFYEALDTL